MTQLHPKFQIPWGAVYKAAEDENQGGRVRPTEPGTLLFGRSTGPWKLLSVAVSQTRYWACSSAQFTIVRPILTEADKILTLNTVDPKGANYFDLRCEDPIIINLGYAAAPFTDNPIDELSERVFFGYVDTIKVVANSRGVKVIVSARDPMRFLIDNKFSGSIIGSNFRLYPNVGFDRPDKENGLNLNPNIFPLDPRDVENALQGPDEDAEIPASPNGDFFLGAGGSRSIDLNKGGAVANDISMRSGSFEKHKIMAWLIYAGSNGACLPAPLTESSLTFITPDDKAKEIADKNLERNIEGLKSQLPQDPTDETAAFERSTRPIASPKDALNTVSGFNVMNRFPLEVLKHLGSLEAEPREMYADMFTGRICWRRKRTYLQPDGQHKIFSFLVTTNKYKVLPGITDDSGFVPPNVIASEVDWSTVGTVSEVVVINPQADNSGSGQDSANKSSGVVSMTGRMPDNRYYPSVIGSAFPGLKRFTRRTRFIFDDTVSASHPDNAAGLIEAFLRIWGKDIRAGTFTIPGDALIRPGHAIELHNMGIFDPDVGDIGDPYFFRAEAVSHKMTAAGPNKGFRTQVAYAEADETREVTMKTIYARLGNGGNPINTQDITNAQIAAGKNIFFKKDLRGAGGGNPKFGEVVSNNVGVPPADALTGGGDH